MSTDILSEQLQRMEAGQLAWFMFCEDLVDADALQLAPLSEDPHAEALAEALDGRVQRHGVRPLFGLCQVGEDGVFDFGAEDIGEAELARIASWTCAHAASRPALQRLYGARALVLSRTYEVEYVYDRPSLWQGLLPPAAPGTLAQAVDAVQGLVPGERAWFWATDQGPTGEALLLVEPILEGSPMQTLNRRVEGVVRRGGQMGHVTRGLLICELDGSFTLETVTPEAVHRRVTRALGKADRRLRWMRQPQDPPMEDLASTGALLMQLEEGQLVHACVVAHKRGETTLHVAEAPEGLARWRRLAEEEGLEHAAGVMHVDGAHLQLILEQPFRHVLPRLARWAAGRYLDHPGLIRLYQLRAVTPEASGVLSRDEAWSFL